MSQPTSAKKASKTSGLNPGEKQILESLLRERTGTPERVTEELDRVAPALAQLVQAKVPIRDILNRFIRNLEYRVTAAQARQYIKHKFNYPPERQPRAAAKKVTRARKSTKAKTTKAKR